MAVGDAYMFPGFLTPVLTQLSFQSHRLLFSDASAEVRGENTPERKVTSTGPVSLGCFTDYLIEVCILGHFQHYFSHITATAHICISWDSPVLGQGSEVSCLRTLPCETRIIQCRLNTKPRGYKSYTLPLSHVGPLQVVFWTTSCDKE